MGDRRSGYSGTFRGPIAVSRVALCMIFASGGREALWRDLIVRVTLSHLRFPFGLDRAVQCLCVAGILSRHYLSAQDTARMSGDVGLV